MATGNLQPNVFVYNGIQVQTYPCEKAQTTQVLVTNFLAGYSKAGFYQIFRSHEHLYKHQQAE